MGILVFMAVCGAMILLISFAVAAVAYSLSSQSPPLRGGGSLALLLAVLVAAGIGLLGVLGYSTAVPQPVVQSVPMLSPPLPPEIPHPVSVQEGSSVEIESVTPNEPPLADRTNSDASPPRPNWISEGTMEQNDKRYVVLSSKQYATEAEAVSDANQQVLTLFENDLRPIIAKSSHVRPRSLTLVMHFVDPAIHDRHTEQVQRDFGTFFAPMYRVWYRVELSPHLREPALANWRHELIRSHQRLAMIGIALFLTIPVGIVLGGRIRRWQPGMTGTILTSGMTLVLLALWIGSVIWISRSMIIG